MTDEWNAASYHRVSGPQTSWGLWVRNRVLAFVSWSRIMEYAQRIFGGAFESGDKFPLPDYEFDSVLDVST